MSFLSLDFIAGRVQKALLAGAVTDESRLDFDLVRDAILVARAYQVGEVARKKIALPSAYYQRACCLEIRCGTTECDGATVQDGYFVNIPPLIGKARARALRLVADTKGKHAWIPSTSNQALPSPFVKKKPKLIYRVTGMEQIWLNDLPVAGMEFICVEGVFADPLHPLLVNCRSGEFSFPIPGDDLEIIEAIAYKRYREMMGMRPDTQNDAVPNT